MNTTLIIPFEELHGKIILIPKAIILLALANARNAKIDDKELADLIVDYLYVFMKSQQADICVEERYDEDKLSFKPTKQG